MVSLNRVAHFLQLSTNTTSCGVVVSLLHGTALHVWLFSQITCNLVSATVVHMFSYE